MSDPCPACGEARRHLEVAHNGMSFWRCDACGSVYMDPPPTVEERHDMYDDPYDGAQTSYYAKRDKKLRRTAKRARILDAYVTTGKRFLEVGCSGGFMVESMRRRGYDATGVDADRPGIAYAKREFPQNTFHDGLFEEVEARGVLGEYDAVYCSEVIEHVPRPQSFVAAIARHMKKGAVLNVTTPDVSHWNKPKNIEKWSAFCPPSHCLYFTPKGLRALFAVHGLDVFRHRFNFKSGIQFYARKT
ncbi:MAG: methyltransferase domain-containing protein [Caulobacterales bacterium]